MDKKTTKPPSKVKHKPYVPENSKTEMGHFPSMPINDKEEIPRYFEVMDSQPVKDSSVFLILNEIRNTSKDISPNEAIFKLAKLQSLVEIIDVGSYIAQRNNRSSKDISDQMPEDY